MGKLFEELKRRKVFRVAAPDMDPSHVSPYAPVHTHPRFESYYLSPLY